MFKVIQHIKLELHRGLEGNTSGPYLFRSNLKERDYRKPLWTLVSAISRSRCSRTFIQNARDIRIIGFSSTVLLLTIFSLTLIPVSHKTNDVDATTGTATNSSTTITVNQATASVDLTAASADGTFAKSEGAGIASFGVKTTNYTGYTLTVAASDDAGKLNNTSGSGSFNTISSVLDEKTFDTSAYNGQWGYKPSKYNSIENVAYWPSPTTKATTLDITKTANPDTNNTYTIALGARAAYTQPTGTYSKTVILTATANQAAYNISYTDNSGDTSVKNLPDITNGNAAETSIKLSTVTPSRDGYSFAGWCTVAPTSSATNCSGTLFQPGDNFGLDQTTDNVITLYATWTAHNLTINFAGTGVSSVQVRTAAGTGGTLVGTVSTSGGKVSGLAAGGSYYLYPVFTNGYYLNSWAKTGSGYLSCDLNSTCSSEFNPIYIAEGGNSTVTITGKAAANISTASTFQSVASKANGGCPDSLSTTISYPLTDTRDDTTYYVAKLADGNCWMVQNLRLGAKSDSLALTTTDSDVATAGFILNNKSADGRISGGDVTVDEIVVEAQYNNSQYYCTDDYGCYYNWYTATAGLGTTWTRAGSVDFSICPKGWTLPTPQEWVALATAYGNSAANMLVENPTMTKENIGGAYRPGFLLGGVYIQDGADGPGVFGSYWSRTASSLWDAHLFRIDTSTVKPLFSYHKYGARVVRCILR